MPTLELHLFSYNLSSIDVALCFLLFTVSYTFFSFFGSSIFKNLDGRTSVVIGINILGLGYFMLTPWNMLFLNELWIVLISLPLIGLSQAMIYRNKLFSSNISTYD